MASPTYLTDKQVAQRYGVDRTTVHRWSKRGVIPRPVKLTAGCTRWIERELDDADARRAEERGAA